MHGRSAFDLGTFGGNDANRWELVQARETVRMGRRKRADESLSSLWPFCWSISTRIQFEGELNSEFQLKIWRNLY